MAKKITSQVDIKYIATGLDNIIKSFEKLDPSTLSTKAQKATADILTSATTMRDQINAAILKGDISQEAAKQYEVMFKKLIGGDFSNKFRAILAGVGGDFDAAFGQMTKRAEELNNEISNIEAKITVEQKGFKREGEEVDFATNTKRNEEAQKALQQILIENSDIEKESLTRAKDKLPTYENLQQAQERANTALAKMTPVQQKQLENFMKTGEVTEANRANVEKLVKSMEGNLSVDEVSQRLKAKQLIDEKLLNTLKEKKNTLIDLENQKIEKNKELQETLDPLKTAEEEIRAQEKSSQAKETYNKNQAASVDIMSTVAAENEKLRKLEEERQLELRKTNEEVEKNNDAMKKQGTTLGKAANQVFSYGVAFSLLRRIYRETLRTIRDLDKALTEMAIVTTMSREEAFGLADTMANLARQTGFTTTEIAKLSTVFFRQGRALSEVIELTTVAAKAARISGISAAESANFLTSAINAFGLAADQALAVSDRFAAIAASSASSYEELAVGLSKFAAQANIAGVSIDFAMGLLAKGIETTREAPETIGTALKTVIARMRELTDLGKTLEDGMDISRVDTALRQVGIALRDEQGQFRDLEKVLTEIGMAWNTYDRNQQASIAVALAGTRQQSRLIAIMQDFDRTLELVNISQDSAGATTAQQVEFMKSLQAATTQLQTAWQDFIRTIGETETIISIVRALTFIIDALREGLTGLGFSGRNATIILLGLVVALKSWKTISKASIAVAKLLNIQTIRQTWSDMLATKGIWAKVVAMKAYIGVITLGIGLIALFVIGAVKMAQSGERAARKLQQMSDEAQAFNFEISRASRNINNFTNDIEKLESLRYLTPQQEEELKNLRERLLELIDEDVANQFRAGLLTWQEVLEEIAKERTKNLAKSIVNSQKVIRSAIGDGFFVPIEDESGQVIGSERIFPTPTKADLRIIRTNFLSLYSSLIEDLSEGSNKLLIDFFENSQFTNDELELMSIDPARFARDNLEPLVKAFDSFVNSVDFEAEKFSDVMLSFKDAYSGLGDNFDPRVLQFIQREFSELFNLMEFVEETGEGTNRQITGFIANIEKLGLTSTKDVQDGFRLFGEGFDDLTQSILEYADTLEHLDKEQAISFAFARASQSAEDLEQRAWLLNQAFRQTTLEIVQNLDKIQSRIKNVNDVQQQWIEGTLSAQDLFNFLQSNTDLLDTLDKIDHFFRGASMSGETFSSILDAQSDMVAQLEYNWMLYHSSTDEATKNQALQQIAILGALTTYRGALKSSTQEQHNYNASLEAYNFLSSIGADTTEVATMMIQNQGAAMAVMANRTQESLKDIQKGFAQNAEGIDELTTNLFDYFTVVGNQLVPNMEAITGLGTDALNLLTMASEQFQSTMDSALDEFLAAREQALKIEKDALDAQKKIYEDYFAALDRLEQQRDRKRSREDIVSQLQRLEGATDERSRQKALELRRELNQLDEQTAQDTIQQARDSLLQGLEDSYTEIENRWSEAAVHFVNELANSGTSSGNAFVNAVNAAGLFSGVDLAGISFGEAAVGSFIRDLETRLGVEGFKEGEGPIVPELPALPEDDTEDDPEAIAAAREAERKLFEDAVYEQLRESRSGFERTFGIGRREDRREAIKIAAARPGFAKGGMVDFTGPAMLHGSRSAPEAVLNPTQTEMFMGLRNALEKMDFGSNGGGSVNIENISISTASLNNNQDFSRAGETLADAFRTAIQRKGITVNTNKT